MNRLMQLAVLATFLGCSEPRRPSGPAGGPPQTTVDTDTAEQSHRDEPPGTPIVVEDSSLTFDPKTCMRGQARFGWGLGSVEVNVLGRDDGVCVFDFTKEVEGGYSVYRCRVPVDGQPVKIYEKNSGITTSFPLQDAKVIRSGNVHFGPDTPSSPPVRWQQQGVLDTGYVNYFADVVTGAGAAAEPGIRVTIRYTLFADEDFTTPLLGIEKKRELKFTLDGGQDDTGLDAAVQGMQAGGQRRVLIREEVAAKITKPLGGVQPETKLAMEIELMKVE